MRRRYRFFACPEQACAKLRASAGNCPDHDAAMVEVILRREDATDDALRAEHAAKRVAQAGAKVGESAGKPNDPLGMAGMFRRMAEDVELGRRFRDSDDEDEDFRFDDDDEDDDDA